VQQSGTCQSVQPTSVDSEAAKSDDAPTQTVPYSTPSNTYTKLQNFKHAASAYIKPQSGVF